MTKVLFEDIVKKDKGMLRGPFGGDLKKEIFVEKTETTYKVYEQGVVLRRNPEIGRYHIAKEYFDNKMHRFEVLPKDFLVSCSGVNYGAIFQLGDKIEKGVINQALLRIRLDNGVIDDDYFYYLFNSLIVNMIVGRKGDSTIPNFPPLSVIKKLEFELPELNYQKLVGRTLIQIDKKIELNNKINAELEAMAKLIYDYWFVQFDFPDANGKPYKSSGGKMVYNDELKREMPESWDVKQLSEVLTFERGISYKSKEITDEGVPMINLNSFNLNGQYKSKGLKYFSGSYKDNKIVSTGDLVIAITDVTRNADIIGKAFTIPDLFEGDILISCDVAKVVPSELVNAQFLEPLFNSEHYHSYIKHFASGTLVLHLNLDGVNWCKIPLPPIEILNKYSELRTDIDKKLTLAIKENKKLTELRDWLLPMLMNGQVTVKDE